MPIQSHLRGNEATFKCQNSKLCLVSSSLCWPLHPHLWDQNLVNCCLASASDTDARSVGPSLPSRFTATLCGPGLAGAHWHSAQAELCRCGDSPPLRLLCLSLLKVIRWQRTALCFLHIPLLPSQTTSPKPWSNVFFEQLLLCLWPVIFRSYRCGERGCHQHRPCHQSYRSLISGRECHKPILKTKKHP